jgi:hypothetical protein
MTEKLFISKIEDDLWLVIFTLPSDENGPLRDEYVFMRPEHTLFGVPISEYVEGAHVMKDGRPVPGTVRPKKSLFSRLAGK